MLRPRHASVAGNDLGRQIGVYAVNGFLRPEDA